MKLDNTLSDWQHPWIWLETVYSVIFVFFFTKNNIFKNILTKYKTKQNKRKNKLIKQLQL